MCDSPCFHVPGPVPDGAGQSRDSPGVTPVLPGRVYCIRLVVFGSTLEEGGAQRFQFVPLGQVVRWLQSHMAEHWELLRHSQTKDAVLSFLLTLEKARRGASRSRGVEQ